MSDVSSETAGTGGKPARAYPPKRQKVPAFARYEGTSAWVKNRRRVRAYALFKAAEAATASSRGV